jgi:hypothetical protein
MATQKKKATPKQKEKVEEVMHEFKQGELHSGTDDGPIVEDRDQAIAIALNEAGLSNPDKQSSSSKKKSQSGGRGGGRS